GKGDRVAIMLPNCPQYIVATFAILRLGAVIVNINPSYTEREFLVIASDSTPRVLITLDALAPMAQKAGPQTTIEQIIVTSIAEYSAAAAPPPNVEGTRPFADLTVPGTHHARAWRAPGTIAADDLAVLQYTGGTTGTPKGAMLTHGNVFANVVQTIAWTNPMYILSGEEGQPLLIPYLHIYAFSVRILLGLWVGPPAVV